MLVRVLSWLALLARSDAAKDAEILRCVTGRRAAPHQPPASAHLARPRRAQRAEQAAAHPATPDATGLAPDAAALARPARRPTLDLPAPTARPTTHPAPDPGPRATNGPRESPLGVQAHPGRAGRPRPFARRLDGLENLRRSAGLDPAPRRWAAWRQFLSRRRSREVDCFLPSAVRAGSPLRRRPDRRTWADIRAQAELSRREGHPDRVVPLESPADHTCSTGSDVPGTSTSELSGAGGRPAGSR